MMEQYRAGFREIEHTADWALEVWAPDLEELFIQAALGMIWLTQTTLQEAPRQERLVELEAGDIESLLVAFLSELLYLGEIDGLAFERFEITISTNRLRAILHGAPLAQQKKEIKAVTYHNLAVQQSREGYRVTIVFDV
jgi:SHS2 domain-containing protein